MIDMTDLARLSWIDFLPPRLGPAKVEAFSGDFANWAQKGVEGAAWPDGRAFIRDLLAYKAGAEVDGPPFGAEAVACLTDQELDEAADLFVRATGVYFRPKYMVSGEGCRGKVRKRRANEEYDMSATEGETGADRLLRLVRAWLQDRADFQSMINQRTGAVDDLLRRHEEALGISRIVEQQKKFAALAEPYSGLVEATRALRSPAYKAAAELVAPSRALPASISHLTRSPAAGLLASIHAQQTQFREIVGFKSPAALEALGGLGLYRNIGASFASRIGIANELSRATKALSEQISAAVVFRSLGIGVLADQAAFASTANRYFDLRIPATTLAAIGALQGVSGVADAIRAHSMFPPGFQMAAALALDGRAARGLVADVLHHYGDRTPDTPVFAGAVEGTAIIDAEVMTEHEAVSFLQRVAGTLLALIRNERDVIVRGGMIGVLVFLSTLIASYVGYRALEVAEQSLDVAEASLRVAEGQPTNADLAAVIRESQATREAFEAEHRELAEAGKRIRYVHDRTPLRAEPRPHGLLIRMVYPDQLLRVTDEQGEWLEVEVFDYQNDSATRGWISRRRVRQNPLP
jgi:hypothetical protein